MHYKSREYYNLHQNIRYRWGKASLCEDDTSHIATRFHWANLSGDYREDRSDWRQLCPKCHYKFDLERKRKPSLLELYKRRNAYQFCGKGHEYTPENTRTRKVGKYSWRICRKCQASHTRTHYYKRKELVQC